MKKNNNRIFSTFYLVICILFSTFITFTLHAQNLETMVLNDANSAPFTNKQGTGLVDIIASEAFRRAGLKLKLIQLPAFGKPTKTNRVVDQMLRLLQYLCD